MGISAREHLPLARVAGDIGHGDFMGLSSSEVSMTPFPLESILSAINQSVIVFGHSKNYSSKSNIRALICAMTLTMG
jgi:hypothetical protein